MRSPASCRVRLARGRLEHAAGPRVSPAWKWCPAASIRRCGVSPPSPMASRPTRPPPRGLPGRAPRRRLRRERPGSVGSPVVAASARWRACNSAAARSRPTPDGSRRRRAGWRRCTPRGQQRMGKPHAIALDPDDALALGLFESSTTRSTVVPVARASRSTVGAAAHAAASSMCRHHRQDRAIRSAPARPGWRAAPARPSVTDHPSRAPAPARKTGCRRRFRRSAPSSGGKRPAQPRRRTTRASRREVTDGPESGRHHRVWLNCSHDAAGAPSGSERSVTSTPPRP